MPYSNFELYNCQRQRVGLCDKVAQTLWIDAVTHPHIRQHLMGIIRQAQILKVCLPRPNIFPTHLTTMKMHLKNCLCSRGESSIIEISVDRLGIKRLKATGINMTDSNRIQKQLQPLPSIIARCILHHNALFATRKRIG